MAVTNGTVKVVIDIKGQGDGARVVDEAARSVKNLKDTASGGVLKGMGDELKDATSGFTSFKGGLSGIKENVLGLPGLIGGIIGTLGAVGAAMADALSPPQTALGKFQDRFDKTIDGLEKRAEDLRNKLNAAGGNTQRTYLNNEQIGTRSEVMEELGTANALYENLLKARERAMAVLRNPNAWPQAQLAASETLRGAEAIKAMVTIETERNRLGAAYVGIEVALNEERTTGLSLMLQQAFAAQQTARAIDLQTKNAWALLAPLQAMSSAIPFGGIAGRAAALGAGKTVNDASNAALLKPRSFGGSAGDPNAAGKEQFRDDMAALEDRARRSLADTSQRIKDDQAANDDRLKRREARDRKAFKASNDNKADAAGMAEFEGDKRAQSVRDFSAALIDGAPVLDQYSASLGKLTETWAQYAKTGEGMAGAVTASLGAIGKAGAQHIKDERARAGVLAIIETGLGFATLFTNPAESAGHFVAAGVLGFAAATGIGAGGGKSAGGSGGGSQQRQRTTLLQSGNGGPSSGPIVNNFSNNNFFGPNKQETAAALYDVLKRQRSAA